MILTKIDKIQDVIARDVTAANKDKTIHGVSVTLYWPLIVIMIQCMNSVLKCRQLLAKCMPTSSSKYLVMTLRSTFKSPHKTTSAYQFLTDYKS